MIKKKLIFRYTTVALEENEFLIPDRESAGIVEVYCHGYKNNKRHKPLDGWYFKSEITRIKNI